MIFFGITLALVIAVLLWYAIKGREWLKTKPWAESFFAWIEPFEIALYRKSETILVGRLLWVGGLFVTFYDSVAVFASSLDLTPVTTRIFDWLSIPADMRGLTVSAFLGILGLLMNRLRNRTSRPIELVAVSDKAAADNPRVAEAIAMADVTKTEAVNVVADAKAA
jgi:hypothetical protein